VASRLTIRGSTPLALASLIAACARGPGDTRLPLARDPYSRSLAALGEPADSLRPCQTPVVAPGPTETVQLQRLRWSFELPAGFAVGPRNLRVDSVIHPAFSGRRAASQWLPGLYVEPVWYRWTRLESAAGPTADASETLLQVTGASGYPMFLAQPPWSLAVSEECVFPVAGRLARVLTFVLRHPTLGAEWGVAALWRTKGNNGYFGFFALTPDPAVQAELLGVIRLQRP